MNLGRAPWPFRFGWLALAVLCLGQAPNLYGDPSCPHCQQSAAAPPPMMAPPALAVPIETPAPEPAVPVVKLRVRAPACGVVGQEMEYRIKVENTSPADAHHVVVRTNLPASVKLVRASPEVHQKDPELQWNLGTLPAFGCHDIVLVVLPVGLADIKSCTRVQFEYGQCVTTKIMAFAPEGSAEAGGRGAIAGPGFSTREPGVAPGVLHGEGGLDVLVDGPKEAAPGQATTYKITIFNKGDRPIYNAGVVLEWSKDLKYVASDEKITGPPGGPSAWPDRFIDQLPPGVSRSLNLQLQTNIEGVHCIKVAASATVTADLAGKTINAKHDVCTVYRRGIAGMTLEMFDRDDPILKFGQTSYPIVVRNQGGDTITNLRVRARVPDLFDVEQVRGPVQYRSNLTGKEYWVEFDPLPRLATGETQSYEISVRAKGREGDARFHIEFTADQLDRAENGAVRWIHEEESTTIVADEESRVRIREISRRKNQE